MRTRIMSGAVLIVILFTCLYFGGWVTFGFSLFISLVGMYELIKVKKLEKTGLAVAAHAEDNELVTGFIKRLREQGRQTENIAHCESRPPIVEIEAISKMLKFGKDVGCPIELVHVST